MREGYANNLALHISAATLESRRRLTVRREPLWMRLGSFVMALASHKVTALVVCGAGAWAVIYVGMQQVWPW